MSLINDMVRTPGLADSTVSFMDVNPDKLDTAYLLCKRYAEERGMKLTLEKTTDRRQSIKGADFVINTALAAPHDRLREGWEIARKNGYRFGGSLHIVHDEAFWVNYYQLRLMEDIVKDILELAPKAWFVLVANPVQAGTTYLKRKYPELNMVGMCHGYNGVYSVARALGLEREHVSFECPGVNHFVWLAKFAYKGKNAFPLIDKWIAEKSEEHFAKCGTCSHEGPKPIDLYKRFGVFPIGDTANPGGGSWGWWYHSDDETDRKWKENGWDWY
jgi:alpha-galactosidase